MPKTLFTIGHSTRTSAALIAMLQAHGVTRLVDIRTVPKSRTNPQFNSEPFAEELRRQGIAYEHEPRLGGLRRPKKDSRNGAWKNANFRGYADHMTTDEFKDALEALARAADTEDTAIMCAEAVPWRCHRNLVADALTARGISVQHIMSGTQSNGHKLTAFAVVTGEDVSYPA